MPQWNSRQIITPRNYFTYEGWPKSRTNFTGAALHTPIPSWVKTRMPPEGSQVCFRQLRTRRPLSGILPCATRRPEQVQQWLPQMCALLDHLVGRHLQDQGHRKAERLGGL
jgi:hypothetical protein